MFPNRNFKTKVPTAKPVTQYHQDEEVRERDRQDIESDSDEVNKQQSTDVEQTREEILQPIRRSSRIKRSTMDTRYKDYIV